MEKYSVRLNICEFALKKKPKENIGQWSQFQMMVEKCMIKLCYDNFMFGSFSLYKKEQKQTYLKWLNTASRNVHE